MNMPARDDEFAIRLAGYHDVVVAEDGTTAAASLPADTPDELAARLNRGVLCLELLERCRRGQQADGSANAEPAAGLHTSAAGEAVVGLGFDELPLKRLGRFRIERELGRGGHGIVFLAIDESLDRPVALKIPRPECLVSSQMRRRFLREAHAAARLAHPNVLSVYACGEAGPLCYLASACCSGPTLAAWLRAQTEQVPQQLAARLVADLAEGVAYAHDRNVLHRDIKPSNIFLDVSPQGFVPVVPPRDDQDSRPGEPSMCIAKLGDFGLAQLTDDVGESTRSGAILGTPAYMAPEQARGAHEEIGRATDVYGLGTVLFELLTGRPPFLGRSEVDTLRQVVADEAPHVRSLRRDVSPDLAAICGRCLEKRAAARYATATELAADLRRFLRGEPTVARPIPIAERLWKWARRRPAIAALAVVSSVALVALLAVSLLYSQHVTRLLGDSERQRHDLAEAMALAQANQRQALQSAYAANLHMALQSWAGGSHDEAAQLLNSYVPAPGAADMRDFAWWTVRHMMTEAPVLATHEGGVTAVAASPDGQYLATVGKDRVIHLWNAETRTLVAKFEGHSRGDVNALAFSPDSSVLASAGDDVPIRRWSVPTGEPLADLRGSWSWNADVEFSLDGRWIASGGGDRIVRLWDAATGAPAAALGGHTKIVRALAFTADTLFSSSEGGEIRAWDLATMAPDARVPDGLLPNPSGQYFCGLAIEPPQWLLGAASYGEFACWNVGQEKFGVQEVRTSTARNARSIACNSDYTVALGTATGTITFMRASQGHPHMRASRGPNNVIRNRYIHSNKVPSIAFVPGRQLLLTGSLDGTARLLPIPQWTYLAHSLSRVAEDAEWRGSTLTIEAWPHSAYIYDLTAERIVCSFTREEIGAPIAVRSAPSAELTAVANDDRQILVLRWADQSLAWTATLPGDPGDLEIDAQEQRVVATTGREVIAFDLRTGEVQNRWQDSARIVKARIVPASNHLATLTEDGWLRLWDCYTGQLVSEHKFAFSSTPSDMTFSVDGGTVAIRSQRIDVWSLSDWTWLGGFAPSFPVSQHLLVGDGTVLAVLGEDGVRLFRVFDGAELLDLRDHYQVGNAMTLSPDGGRIVLLWDVYLDFLDGRAEQ